MILTLKLLMLFCLVLVVCLVIACSKTEENLRLVFMMAIVALAMLFFWSSAVLWIVF